MTLENLWPKLPTRAMTSVSNTIRYWFALITRLSCNALKLIEANATHSTGHVTLDVENKQTALEQLKSSCSFALPKNTSTHLEDICAEHWPKQNLLPLPIPTHPMDGGLAR